MKIAETNKSALEDTLEQLDRVAAYRAHMEKDEEKRQVNVRLGPIEFGLLERLSEHFSESRTSMAQHLLQAAIYDACASVGIDTNDDKVLSDAARSSR
jgi:uncharacterized membrane protein YccC